VHPEAHVRRMSTRAGTKAASASSTKLRPRDCLEPEEGVRAALNVYRQDFVQAEKAK